MTKNASHLRIGGHRIRAGAILAPMSGVTDAGFRRVAARFGASMVVSEMVASDQLALGETEARLRAEGRGLALHIVQIAGCEPHWMAEGARAAEASGADIIDINMGCPAKRVTNGWSGSALMRDLDAACRLIEATVKAAHVPVTLKTRLGWDHASLNAPELARRATDLGVAMVTIHGRTRQQFYKGQADWTAVAAVRGAISLPLVVNGDIGSVADARSAKAASGADAVMIGRAAMGQPWLCGRVSADLTGEEWREPSPQEKADAAIEHYQWLLASMGRDKGLRHARKHVAAYLDIAGQEGRPVEAETAARLLTSDCPEAVIAGLYEAMTAPATDRATPRAA